MGMRKNCMNYFLIITDGYRCVFFSNTKPPNNYSHTKRMTPAVMIPSHNLIIGQPFHNVTVTPKTSPSEYKPMGLYSGVFPSYRRELFD